MNQSKYEGKSEIIRNFAITYLWKKERIIFEFSFVYLESFWIMKQEKIFRKAFKVENLPRVRNTA